MDLMLFRQIEVRGTVISIPDKVQEVSDPWLPVLVFVVCCGVGGGGGVDVYSMYLMLLRRIQDIR